jgi:hypothetical protein
VTRLWGSVAWQRLDKLIVLANEYACNSRGTVGGSAFYAVRVGVMHLRRVGACSWGLWIRVPGVSGLGSLESETVKCDHEYPRTWI